MGFPDRYASALMFPLASFAITRSLFPIDRSQFSPLFMLSVVCAALLGGIRPGFVATAISVLFNVMTVGAVYRLIAERSRRSVGRWPACTLMKAQRRHRSTP